MWKEIVTSNQLVKDINIVLQSLIPDVRVNLVLSLAMSRRVIYAHIPAKNML